MPRSAKILLACSLVLFVISISVVAVGPCALYLRIPIKPDWLYSTISMLLNLTIPASLVGIGVAIVSFLDARHRAKLLASEPPNARTI